MWVGAISHELAALVGSILCGLTTAAWCRRKKAGLPASPKLSELAACATQSGHGSVASVRKRKST
jgi:hypothetical protein